MRADPRWIRYCDSDRRRFQAMAESSHAIAPKGQRSPSPGQRPGESAAIAPVPAQRANRSSFADRGVRRDPLARWAERYCERTGFYGRRVPQGVALGLEIEAP